jgi:hypothetical protein
LWPESQLRLWLLLLEKRKETTQIPNLCNVPAGLWLYFGDDYVSLRQVRKCMTTWSQRFGSSRGHKVAKQAARRLLEDLPLSGLSRNAKANLVTAMGQALLRGIASDDERRELHARLFRAMGADAKNPAGSARGKAIVDLVLIRLLAAHHLNRNAVPDHIFEWARAWHLYGLHRYMQALDTGDVPVLAGVSFETPTFDQLIPSSCRDILSSIGMALSVQREDALPAPFFHPSAWKDGQGQVELSFQIQPSPILLPAGQQHAVLHLQVEARVSDPSGGGRLTSTRTDLEN